jgi:hypothetical protein
VVGGCGLVGGTSFHGTVGYCRDDGIRSELGSGHDLFFGIRQLFTNIFALI